MPFSVSGLLTSTFIGAASASVMFGFGSAASSLFTQPAIGFWAGAAQGAITGSITGIAGTFVNAAFTGGNITLKAAFQGMVIGAAVGGIIGGIDGGLRAQENDANFWSGKNNYNDIKIGKEVPSNLSNETNFSGTEFDVNQETLCPLSKNYVQEDGSWTCSYQNKLISDDYFGVTDQGKINSEWLLYANDSKKGYLGLKPNEIFSRYQDAGYSVNVYSGPMNNQNALPWMVNEMKNNRIVQINFGTFSGHNVSVQSVHYMNNFSHQLIRLQNSVKSGVQYFQGIGSNIKQIFSVWKL